MQQTGPSWHEADEKVVETLLDSIRIEILIILNLQSFVLFNLRDVDVKLILRYIKRNDAQMFFQFLQPSQ